MLEELIRRVAAGDSATPHPLYELLKAYSQIVERREARAMEHHDRGTRGADGATPDRVVASTFALP